MKRRDDAFARRLREAGAAVTPAASDALHARVMADVRREAAVASSAPTADATRSRWWWGTVGAVAAAFAVGIGVWVAATREPGTTPRDEPGPITALPPVPSIEAVIAETVDPVRGKIHEARFAYLDRDSKRLARFLIRAVPGVPADAKSAAERL